jgi:hypothetical protein
MRIQNSLSEICGVGEDKLNSSQTLRELSREIEIEYARKSSILEFADRCDRRDHLEGFQFRQHREDRVLLLCKREAKGISVNLLVGNTWSLPESPA